MPTDILITGHADINSTSQGGLQYNNAGAPAGRNKISLDHHRRTFGVSDELASLIPNETAFFTILSKIGKKKTDNPVWKANEERQQWQRRNFIAKADNNGASLVIELSCDYDKFGKMYPGNYGYSPRFILHNQILAIEKATVTATTGGTGTLYCRVGYDGTDKTISYGQGTEGSTGYTACHVLPLRIIQDDGTVINIDTPTAITFGQNARGQVVGTAFPEASSYPGGWIDELSMADFYAQIFKNAIPMFSGTSMATAYRMKKDEFARKWVQVMKEHKMDIAHSILFGVGHQAESSGILSTANTGIERFTWGLLPYISAFGKVIPMSYSSTGYNDFVDFATDYFRPENGIADNKVWLASHKIIAWFAKLGQGFSFIGNTSGANAHKFDVMTKPSKFGFNITEVSTPFGNFKFVPEALLRGQWEDYAIMVDLENVAWRPLAANGISRDTFIQQNVQNPGVDGRVDQIITEAGLEITLPERHAIFKFSN